MAEFGLVDDIVYSLKAEISLKNGEMVNIAPSDIKSYAPSGTMSSAHIPLGAAAAMTYSLVFNNEEYGLTAEGIDGAWVKVYASQGAESTDWEDFGVWYIDAFDMPELDSYATISGADAMEKILSGTWKDAKEDYPRTLKLMVQTICSVAGLTLATPNFRNAEYTQEKMPEWSASCSMRDVIANIAACAAGFARINYSGQLEICTIGDAGQHSVTPDYYTQFSRNGLFTFNCLQYRFETTADEEEADYTRFAIDSSIEDKATNTLQMSGNPLMTQEMANDIVQTLRGMQYAGASLDWFGGIEVLPGDEIELEDINGNAHKLILTAHSMDMDGGIKASSSCDMPTEFSETEGFGTGANAFNPDGTLNVNAISGLDRKVVSATTGYFENLTADSAKLSKLLSAAIWATNLWAQSIDTYSTETDYLTATIANIFKATIEKITAGTVATDELYAAIADITALKVGSLKASDITADRLGAALAAFTVMTAGTAEFDRATVQHLVANALNLSFGTAGDVFIKNLRVAYAQMVSAAIGNLCIKAADGKYYTIGVDQNGNVTATPATVSGSEIDAGQMNDGKVILETNITAENLSTSNLLATYALINSIDAARIDVDQLFAREGFIDRLTTSTLLNDTSIQMLIGRNDELSRWFTFDDEEGFSIRKPAYTDVEGVAHPESIWRFTAMETGIRIYRTDIKQPLLSAEKDCVSAPKIQMGNMLMRATKQGTIVFREVE